MRTAVYKEGSLQLHSVLVDGLCSYTGKTEAMFKQEGYQIIDFDLAIILMKKAQKEQYCKPWKRISKSEWYEMLEVLPPEKWKTTDGIEMFAMSEYTIGDITGHYARYRGKYFYANRSAFSNRKELNRELQKTIKG